MSYCFLTSCLKLRGYRENPHCPSPAIQITKYEHCLLSWIFLCSTGLSKSHEFSLINIPGLLEQLLAGQDQAPETAWLHQLATDYVHPLQKVLREQGEQIQWPSEKGQSSSHQKMFHKDKARLRIHVENVNHALCWKTQRLPRCRPPADHSVSDKSSTKLSLMIQRLSAVSPWVGQVSHHWSS